MHRPPPAMLLVTDPYSFALHVIPGDSVIGALPFITPLDVQDDTYGEDLAMNAEFVDMDVVRNGPKTYTASEILRDQPDENGDEYVLDDPVLAELAKQL